MVNEDDKKLEILDKILASNESIRAVVASAKKHVFATVDDKTRERRAANHIIAHYSNRCGISGSLSGLPAFLPIVGAIYSVFGASAADSLAALKFEVEMSLALMDLAGYDISDPSERRFAILLACASLQDEYDATEPASILDIVNSSMEEYSTRQITKSMVKLVSQAIMKLTARRAAKFFPVVSIAVGGAMNMAMTIHTGHKCYAAIRRRKRHDAEMCTAYAPEEDPDLM